MTNGYLNFNIMTNEEKTYYGLIGAKSARTPKIINKQVEKLKITERSVHNAVCKYLKLQYPNVMFLSDFGAGLKMTPGNAQLQNKQKSDHSFPDLMIFEPVGCYAGLFIEIKAEKLPNTEHTRAQSECLKLLTEKGYKAVFGIGFDCCKEIIDNYLALHYKVAF